MQRGSKVLLLVVEPDLERTKALRSELANADFDVRCSSDVPLGESSQRAWEQAFHEACCVVAIWSRSSLHDPTFQGRAEQARLRGVLCPLVLDRISAAELPVGQQSKGFGDLTDWAGSPGESPFPEIVARAHALARVRTKRHVARAVQWTALVGALLLAGVLVREWKPGPRPLPPQPLPETGGAPAPVVPVVPQPLPKPPAPAGLGGGPQPRPAPNKRDGGSPRPAPKTRTALGPDWVARAGEATRTCTAGQGDGCNALGWLRELGHGVRQSHADALQSYERGCALGSGRACLNAARMFAFGLGTDKDEPRARERRHRGCELHYDFACAEEMRNRFTSEALSPYGVGR